MKDRTFSRLRLRRNVTAMVECDVFDDGQPDPAAVPFPLRGWNSVKTLEDPLQVFRGDSAAIVIHAKIDAAVRGLHSGNHNPLRPTVQNRILDQVVQSLLQDFL